VVDEAALLKAVREKGVRAGLDVFQQEPAGTSGDFTNPVGQEPGIYGTHHVGASTDQAQVAIAHEVLRIVSSFMTSGEVPNCVNRLAKSTASYVLAVRHHNRPGVLAHVFKVLADGSINVEEVENISYHGAVASLARIHLDSRPADPDMTAIRKGNPHIISVELSGLNGR
jgi:D-3-phosphoglycerate dehydrogenase